LIIFTIFLGDQNLGPGYHYKQMHMHIQSTILKKKNTL
jgi:hypothetical protein